MQTSVQVIDPAAVDFLKLQGGGVSVYIGSSVSLCFNSMNEAALWLQTAADKADALMAEAEES